MNTVLEILCLTLIFTVLALFFDIHGPGRLSPCILHHLLAFGLALMLSKVFYDTCKN